MEDTHINYFQRFVNSMRPDGFYLTIREESTGKALRYFLLLALLLTAAVFIRTALTVNSALLETADFIERELPDFTLENGTLSVYDEMPIVHELDGVMAVVDTSGQYTEDVLDQYPSGLFISADKLVYKKNAFESRTMNFSEFENVVFTKADAVTLVKDWSGPVIAVIAIAGFLFAIAGKFIGLLFASLLGVIINAVLKTRLSYGVVLRTSAYVLTLPMLLKTLVALTGLTVPFFFIIYYGVAAAYFYVVLRMPAEEYLG